MFTTAGVFSFATATHGGLPAGTVCWLSVQSDDSAARDRQTAMVMPPATASAVMSETSQNFNLGEFRMEEPPLRFLRLEHPVRGGFQRL
jgi:hypothetical protein